MFSKKNGYTLIYKNKENKWYVPTVSDKGNLHWNKNKASLHKIGLQDRKKYNFIIGFRVIPIEDIEKYV